MAGKPFQVGRFAHTLRVRLMREHLGVDVDSMEEDHLMTKKPVKPEHEQEKWQPDADENDGYRILLFYFRKTDDICVIQLREGPQNQNWFPCVCWDSC
jgi:hypothetical protein